MVFFFPLLEVISVDLELGLIVVEARWRSIANFRHILIGLFLLQLSLQTEFSRLQLINDQHQLMHLLFR